MIYSVSEDLKFKVQIWSTYDGLIKFDSPILHYIKMNGLKKTTFFVLLNK